MRLRPQVIPQFCTKHRGAAILVACLASVVVLGWTDYITGPKIGFSLFYFVPIALASWLGPGWSGYLVAIASAVAWYRAETLAAVAYSSPLIPYWNATMRLLIFLITSRLVGAVRAAQAGLERKVEEKDGPSRPRGRRATEK